MKVNLRSDSKESRVTNGPDGAKSNTVKAYPDSRRLYFIGDVNEEKSERIVTGILDLEAKDPLKDIILYIDSYGGYIDSFFAMHDAIKMSRCNVATIGTGKTMSCGLLLLISGTPGYRFITPNARVLIHRLSGFSGGNVSDMEDDVKEAIRLQNKISQVIVDYTKITRTLLDKMMLRQTYLSAEEAVELGIVDKIAENNAQIYKKVRV